MSLARRESVLLSVAAVLVALGVIAWKLRPIPATDAGHSPAVSTSLPKAVVAAAPAAVVAPALPEGRALTAAGRVVDTAQQDERQTAKITRGLAENPGGGILVQDMPAGSVASLLRVHVGDVIVSVNGNAITSLSDFAKIYREQGLPRQMTVISNGRELHRH